MFRLYASLRTRESKSCQATRTTEMSWKEFYKGKRILITGGAGYLATNILHMLADVECRVMRLDRPGSAFERATGTVQVVNTEADIRAHGVLESALRGIDVVFHLAAQTSVRVAEDDPAGDLEINVLPMVHLLETCHRKGWSPIVLFAGTVTEAGMTPKLPVDETHRDVPVTVYDLDKLMAESYLKLYAVAGAVRGATLRLSNVYGPGPKSSSRDRGILNLMMKKAISGESLIVYGPGEYIRDYVYVDDVSRAFLMAGAGGDSLNGRHFIIGSGKGHSLAEAFNLVADRAALKTGRKALVSHVDPPASMSVIETRSFVANSSVFSEATGWRATVCLEEGIDRTLDFLIRSPDDTMENHI